MPWILSIVLALLAATVSAPGWPGDTPIFLLPPHHLESQQLAIVVNDASPLSVRLARYYQQRRKIPITNLIHVKLPVDKPGLSPAEFARLRNAIRAQTAPEIQAYVLTWMLPFRVGCMSVTSALTMGYDADFCRGQQPGTCRTDKQQSAYFNSLSRTPNTDYQIRPAMMLAAPDWSRAKALVDRGIAADQTMPGGTAYLLSTTDKNRNVRAAQYPQVVKILGSLLRIEIIEADALRERRDVLFYFTGLASVRHLESLKFLPGAIADHLTSAGGILTGSGQMSIMSWLEAGASGSYGTVVEPCNYPQKFPLPGVVMQHYLAGETLIEAYWKSVMWPKEGVFVGEPLAAPFSGYRVTRTPDHLTLKTYALRPGIYQIHTSASVLGPFTRDTVRVLVRPGQNEFFLPDLGQRVYKLIKER